MNFPCIDFLCDLQRLDCYQFWSGLHYTYNKSELVRIKFLGCNTLYRIKLLFVATESHSWWWNSSLSFLVCFRCQDRCTIWKWQKPSQLLLPDFQLCVGIKSKEFLVSIRYILIVLVAHSWAYKCLDDGNNIFFIAGWLRFFSMYHASHLVLNCLNT